MKRARLLWIGLVAAVTAAAGTAAAGAATPVIYAGIILDGID